MYEDKNVLIVEDNEEINKLLQMTLKQLDIPSVSAYSASEGLLQLEREAFDLILLDLMLPGMPGEDFIEKVRETSEIPIIVISAKVDIEDRVNVLKSGADDYIVKPFNQAEVMARIEVQLRKALPKTKSENHIQWRDLSLDKARHKVLYNQEVMNLTNAEFDILAVLMTHPEVALSKQKIYEQIWTGPYLGDDNTVSVHISNIRKKIAQMTDEEYIKTVWGIGFILI